MTRVASSAEGDKERCWDCTYRENYPGGGGMWEGLRKCSCLKVLEKPYMGRCLCSDFWKHSEVIWHTASSSPASSCTVAVRRQYNTWLHVEINMSLNSCRVPLTSNCASMAPLLRPSFSVTMESLKACWSIWVGSWGHFSGMYWNSGSESAFSSTTS